jgi:Ca-activated chloride channel family protein
MINTNIIFEKKKLNKNKKDHLMLLEIKGFHKNKKQKIQKDRKILNISLVIDVSGSMGMPIENEFNYSNPNQLFLKTINHNNNIFKSKLDLVKNAAKNAINSMEYGDYISLIAFDSAVETVIECVELTKDNKSNILNKIEELETRGSTNLHGGWLEGCKQVARNKKENYLNRVIVLTDGQANNGETNSDIIATDVLNVYNKGVSTTCFGVGSDFNEDLLQDMSNSGGGNFYYIEKEEEFIKMFNEEFQGINNIAAFDIKFDIKFEDKFEVIENYNNLKKSNDSYLLPSVYKDSKLFLLFRVSTKNLLIKDKSFGELNISYKNENSQLVNEIINLKIKVTKDDEWDTLIENEEMKVQEVLLTVAKRKEEATRAISSGNILRAKEILSDSLAMVGSSSINDARLTEETTLLNKTLLDSETKSSESLKKDIFYQSYKTRTNR